MKCRVSLYAVNMSDADTFWMLQPLDDGDTVSPDYDKCVKVKAVANPWGHPVFGAVDGSRDVDGDESCVLIEYADGCRTLVTRDEFLALCSPDGTSLIL